MVKRPGVLSKVQMLNLVLGVGVFSLLPTLVSPRQRTSSVSEKDASIEMGERNLTSNTTNLSAVCNDLQLSCESACFSIF